jgi:uncharacterized protein YndB with AHSA1/START domain
MRHVEVVQRFEAPPEKVWEVYTDHERWSEWAGLPGSRLVREGSPDRNGRGAVRSFAGGVREEVVDFHPPKRMTYRVIGSSFPLRDHFGEVDFEPDGAGTRITWRCRFDSAVPGAGWLLERGITFVFARALRGLEQRLRR